MYINLIIYFLIPAYIIDSYVSPVGFEWASLEFSWKYVPDRFYFIKQKQ